MKIVSKKYLICGYKNPIPSINLNYLFKIHNNIYLFEESVTGMCALRRMGSALWQTIPYSETCISLSCEECFWGSANKKTNKERKEAFDCLKNGGEIKFIDDEN